MNEMDLYRSFSQLDEEILEKSEKSGSGKMWIKWTAAAAALGAVIITALLFFLLPSQDTGRVVSVGGIIREYKNVSSSSQETAIIWPLEYLTEPEKYHAMNFEGREYSIRRTDPITGTNGIGHCLGICEAFGYDIYTDSQYSKAFDVYAIQGVEKTVMVAVQMDSSFYVFRNTEYDPPNTFGEMINLYSMKEYVTFEQFGITENREETNWYILEEDAALWSVLESCQDAPFIEEDPWSESWDHKISFTIISEELGIYKQGFMVSRDGYVQTNIFEWAYTFYIGPEKSEEIYAYVQAHSREAEPEPYAYSLAGTITEIHEDYILIDDSCMCMDPSAGMVFRIPMEDIRVRRCVEFSGLQEGDFVVVWFTDRISPDGENIISGAYSISSAILEDGAAMVPE